MIKKLFTIFAILISITTFNSLSHSIEADVFVQSTVNRAASTLGGNLTREQRVEELKKIAKETVDIYGVGMYSLGATRKSLTKEQLKLIIKFLKNISLKAFRIDWLNTLTQLLK